MKKPPFPSSYPLIFSQILKIQKFLYAIGGIAHCMGNAVVMALLYKPMACFSAPCKADGTTPDHFHKNPGHTVKQWILTNSDKLSARKSRERAPSMARSLLFCYLPGSQIPLNKQRVGSKRRHTPVAGQFLVLPAPFTA